MKTINLPYRYRKDYFSYIYPNVEKYHIQANAIGVEKFVKYNLFRRVSPFYAFDFLFDLSSSTNIFEDPILIDFINYFQANNISYVECWEYLLNLLYDINISFKRV